jgi:AcrR family transcriptional regulator
MVKRAAVKKASRRSASALNTTTPPLIWQRVLAARPTRKLDYPGIVRIAMEIADELGLDAISMRNVASRLEAGTMSLYRYVAGKGELLDLILDSAYGEIAIPRQQSKDWRSDILRVARETRTVLKAHPWLTPLITMRPSLGPNYLRWFEFLLATTSAPGRAMRTQVRMIGTIWAYVTGFVGYETGEIETNRRHNLTEERKRELAAPYVQQVLSTGRIQRCA